MITKEELEKLIKDKQGIYLKDCGCISKIYPHRWKQYEIWNTRTLFNCKSFMRYDLRDLYKTKDEAEFTLEFGNITRTETLSLPTWEEVQKETKGGKYIEIEFYNAEHNRFVMGITEKSVFVEDSCEDYGGFTTYYNDTLSRENYIKACRVAKDLFLGKEPKGKENA